ncbi:MAG TPA: glutamate--tRNA ligase [Candidatus Brocadiia bacterium]|nr:glutamate--tRNA ligase [Candidatus Brocadiia bacterium]
MSQVRVRIAPSPTGEPHVGTAYIALFNYAFAHREGGKFIFRSEDTDRERSTTANEDAILRSLKWLGLQWDEGPDVGGPHAPYRQSERAAIYKTHADALIESGKAYYCFCSAERLAQIRDEQAKNKQAIMYDGFCRGIDPAEARRRVQAGEPRVIRLAVDRSGETCFEDKLRGRIAIRNEGVDDQVLLKSDGFPTYHLASVVDDRLMGVTHVIRAEEWISSTPKHVLLYNAFGWTPPMFVHMPLLRNQDKSKISKRRNPTSLDFYRNEGYLPEAMLNFLALMGYSMPDGREVFPLSEFIAGFSLDRVSTSGPVFDLQKLEWINGEYIRRLDTDELATRICNGFTKRIGVPDEAFKKAVALIRERIRKLSEFDDMTAFMFGGVEDYDPALLIQKKTTKDDTIAMLKDSAELIAGAADFTPAATEAAFRGMAERAGAKPGNLFMVLRIAVTGRKVSTPLFETMELIGQEECGRRISVALGKLAGA